MLRCKVVQGLVKEVEDELNKFLEQGDISVLHMTQSETGESISVTLVYEYPEPPR